MEGIDKPGIDHVIVLMLENRSFDHMLGFLDHPDPEFDGLTRGGPYTNPGWDGGEAVEATPTAKLVLPLDPDHSHDAVMEQLGVAGGRTGGGADRQATNQGFVTSYERKGRGLATPAFGGLLGPVANLWERLKSKQDAPITGRGPLAMACQATAHVPVLSKLALEFCVCTNWFSSVPGETWPNRNFLHAASSDGETDIDVRFYTMPTVFELLEAHDRNWHIYHDDTPQVWAFPKLWDTPARHANWFGFAEFAKHAATGTLPAYSFIEPNHRPPLHTLDHDPIIGVPDVSDSQHPGNNNVSNAAYDDFADDADADTDFARSEALIASVYESLRANPELFERSLLVITYDEHGGLYDHVAPPVGVPNPGAVLGFWTRLLHAIIYRKAKAFDFGMLGLRVPAVLVSPFVAASTVRTEVHDHASVPATLRALFAPDAEPLTPRDAWATPFHDVASLTEPRRSDLPDLSAYTVAALGGHGSEEAVPVDAADAADDQVLPVPVHYKDFADQADLVWQRLVKIGEPETVRPIAAEGARRPVDISHAFARAAEQHRADAAVKWPAPTSRTT